MPSNPDKPVTIQPGSATALTHDAKVRIVRAYVLGEILTEAQADVSCFDWRDATDTLPAFSR